ncbi:hypothetical protein JTB14_031504 [Gonioctena quinquepunctata]|nr:hypothetical protein JTB14_031504 [Gonioctena quinquepunctata]
MKESLITDDQRSRLNDFLNQRGVRSVWGRTDSYTKHHINTNDHQPIASSPYRMSPAKKLPPKAELDRLLDEGIIEECESPWLPW